MDNESFLEEFSINERITITFSFNISRTEFYALIMRLSTLLSDLGIF